MPAAQARPVASGLSLQTAANSGAAISGSGPPPHSHRLLIAGLPAFVDRVAVQEHLHFVEPAVQRAVLVGQVAIQPTAGNC